MLDTIRYLVFGIQIVRPNSTIRIKYSDFLDTEYYSVFGIRIFSIPNSIQYSVFVISENRIIFGIRYSVKKRYSSHSDQMC